MKSVSVQVEIDGGDAEELDQLTRQMRAELLELDVADVSVDRSAETPEGAKGDAVTIGTLVVTLTPMLLGSVCQLLRIWVSREKGRRIVLKDGDRSLEISGSATDRHQQLIDTFLKER